MSPDQAIEYALSTKDTSPQALPEPREAEPPDPLTRRQSKVALLTGQGLSNHQIAGALAISKNTVAHHVAQILKELDPPSRSRIAVWVAEKGLRDPE